MADLGALLPAGGKTQTDVWAAPQHVFDELQNEFEFTLDPCSDGTNAKCETFFTPADDGLSQSWANHTVFMNPPYSQNAAWMRKAYDESIWPTVVCLVPARTDTRWWHDYAMKGEVRFLRGRLKFGDAKHSAPFPSAVVVFRALA
jgi:phage N-6-adenine-methyltransferase